ncbi:MAG: hypothetical protein PWQ35_454 [Patescibacteria group bacterium]|nr:hypothetical protein [Patescibacteria group bacterium]
MMEYFIIAGAVLVILAAALEPKIGLYLTALSLPIIGRDFYIQGFIIPVSDLIAFCTLLGFFLHLFFSYLFKPQKRERLIFPLFYPFAIFFLINILSIIVNGNSLSAWYYFIRWPVFLYIAYIFVPFNVIKDPKTLKKTVILVTVSAILVLISGFASLFGQDWQNSFFRLKSIYIFNSYPFGENHNLVAEFLNIGAFFILVIRDFIKTKRGKRIIDILFILASLGIILTFSRTGWIILFLQSALFLFYRLKHRPREKMMAAIFACLFLIVISPLFFKMSSLQEKNTSSTENRWLLTEIALTAFYDKPWLGHGSGTFVDLVATNTRFTVKYGAPVDSHGMLQKMLAETGILGLLSWLFILLYLVRFTFITLNKYYPRVNWVLPFALAALGGIFFQFFNTSYFKGRVWLPLVLFLLAIKFSEALYGKKDKSTPYPSQLK